MKNTPFLSDFTAGELSDKYTGRVEDGIYYKGARTLENMRPIAQGGFKHTGGSFYAAALPNEEFRLIPFIVSEILQYLICLGRSQIRVYPVNTDGTLGVYETVDPGLTYSAEQLYEVQYCQNYNQLYLAHRVHKPKVFTYTGAAFTFGDLTITVNATETAPFQIPGEYPGCCAFFSGRLFLAGTTVKPQGIWASQPFEPGNFTTYETYEETVTQLKPSAEWTDPQVPETEDIITSRDMIGDGNSFYLEPASDQNDGIVWMAAGKDLLIGTITSEWVIPESIHANDISAEMKTRYGTTRIQAKLIGEYVLFIQRGGKKLREYAEDEDCMELTFTAEHITGPGILQVENCRVPDPLVFLVRSDGEMAVLMYNKPHEIQAWYRITSKSGDYESVASVTSEVGDYVYAVVSSGSARWIERLDDDSLTQMTEIVSVVGGAGTVSANLQDQEIQLWNASEQEVVTTAVDGLFSCSLSDGIYYAGKGFTSILETMSIETGGDMGTSQLKTRRINEISLRVLQGGDFSIGYSSETSNLEKVTDTGLIRVPFRGGSEMDASIHIERDKPYPLVITMIIPEIEVNEV